jgi:hypothetical protein
VVVVVEMESRRCRLPLVFLFPLLFNYIYEDGRGGSKRYEEAALYEVAAVGM